jgi:hypothetical protein
VVRIYRAVVESIHRLVRLNASFQDELPPTPRPLRWLNICAALLTIAATAAAFERGLDQRMHLVAPDSVEALAQTIGIDLSQRFHGTTGYVGRTEVLQTLFNAGFTGRQDYLDKLGIQYPANSEMPDLINDAIQKALALKDLPKNSSFANRQLYVPEANDPGLVDYVSWSFDIFGFRIESLYYFYFLVLGVSIGLFLICFRADALPLVALSGLMVAFLILLSSRLFEGVWLRTVFNQRFLTSLCFVSYLHLLFTLLIYRRPTWSRVVVTVLQAAIFVFVMFTRSSAVWLILSLALIIAVNVMFRLGRPEQETKATKAAKLGFSWPLVLLVGGVLCSVVYKASILHPIYSIGIFLPYHMVWHNAYMGLAVHPDWNEVGDKRDGKLLAEPLTDNMAWMGAAVEAEQRYGLAGGYLNNTEIGGLPGIKMALHEKLIKERLLRFAFQHPRYMLELMLWYKPKRLLEELVSAYGKYDWNVWSLLCPAVFLVIAVMACRRLEIPSHVGRTLVSALVVTGLMSLLAPFWTYPIYHLLGETFLIWTAIFLGFTALLLNKAIAKPVAWLRAKA